MSFSVIIPTRSAANIRECVHSIKACNLGARVIVVNDDESGAVAEALDAYTRRIEGSKPFCFSRNVNLGIMEAGRDDVLLLNDDTRLLSGNGFSFLADVASRPSNWHYGVISCGITGAVGNAEQIARPGTILRPATHHTLVFVAVFIRRQVIDEVGMLDQRFVGYGYDDDDYCERVRQTGYDLGVFDGCVVEHGKLPSQYRNQLEGGVALPDDLAPNRARFVEKWGFAPGQRVIGATK